MITKLDHFKANYILRNQSIFKMGAENPQLKMTGITHLSLHQEIEKDKIFNTIITHSQTLETENSDLKPAIDEINYITNISKKINLTRNNSGKIINVDKKSLNDDWELWKKNKMQTLIPEKHKQRKFTKKYESGLHYFEQGLQNSLSHILLLPQIYDALYQTNRYQNPTTASLTQASKLIDNLNIEYCFYPFYIKQEDNLLIMCFETRISNKEHISEKLLPLYHQNKDFSIENYHFKITTKYCLDPNSYKILYAELKLIEKMHNNLCYEVDIDLSEKDIEVEHLKNKIFKEHNGKIYSKENWETLNTTKKLENSKSPMVTTQLVAEKEDKQKTKEIIFIVSLLLLLFTIILLILVYE